MSAVEHAKHKRKATGGSGKWTQYKPGASGANPQWAEVSDVLLIQLLCDVTNDGDAVLFGVTRDGGTLVLTICSGDERGKYYARTGDEMNQHITTLLHLSRV